MRNGVFLFFVVCGLAFVCLAQEEPNSTALSTTPTATPAMKDHIPAEHIMRKVFDENYVGPYASLDYPSQTAIKWAEWEDVYFRRDFYRKKLEDEVSRNWSVGIWWWMAEAKVVCDDQVIRGGPITFVVKYPLVDWREENLSYSVYKDDCGNTKVDLVSGEYFTPRFGYLVATAIMIPSALAFIGLVFLTCWILYMCFKLCVDALTEKLMEGNPNPATEPWVRKFVACVLGALVCLISTIAWLIAVLS